MNSSKPVDVRRMIRRGVWTKKYSTGECLGYKQANISIVHQSFADDFEEFCKLNSAPAPLLYRSRPGELNSPLAEDCDIQSDLFCYGIYEGSVEKIAADVKDYDWKEMVTFYIGCSFSFEEAFLKNSIPLRNIERNTDVGIYRTNIRCKPVGPFSCNMIVTMRPMPKEFVGLAAIITSQMLDVHGAPIHIGNPATIGIQNFLETSHSNGAVERLIEGDVPVFWACGITTLEALKFSNCPLSITNSCACLLFTDVETPDVRADLPDREKCVVVEYFERCQGYSLLSAATMKILKELNSAVSDDPDNQGFSNFTGDEFTKIALALSHSKSVAITLPYYVDHNQGTELLSGAMSLAGMLQALGKNITFLSDEKGIKVYGKIVAKEVNAGILKREISVVSVKTDGKGFHENHYFMNDNGNHRYDVVLVMERAGREKDGKHCSIEEIGESFVVNGVSNWGCLGLAFALFALRSCRIHDRYCRRGLGLPTNAKQRFGSAIPTVEREELNSDIVNSECSRDALDQEMTEGSSSKSHSFHAAKIEKMLQIISQCED